MENFQMSKRKLRNLEVSSIGYGAMGLSHGYGPTPSKEESIKIIKKVYEMGYTFFDTAEAYGHGENEIIVGEGLKDIRDKVKIATKLHIVDPSEGYEKIIRRHLDESFKRLPNVSVFWVRFPSLTTTFPSVCGYSANNEVTAGGL